MVGCDLCKKIWNNVNEYKNQFKNSWYEEISIVMKDDSPWLYIPVDDSYYSGTYMPVNFCPKCGRKINLNYKIMR